jgi:PAS domain S-box-containing protein
VPVVRDPTSRHELASIPGGVSDPLFRLLVDSVRDYAIFMLDPSGHVASWNRGAERIKGYVAEEIIGHHFSVFYVDDEVRAGKCEHELEIAAQVGRFEDEGWRVRKDGSRFWANVVITAMRDSHNALVAFAKVTRDLTERKRNEDARAAWLAAEEANQVKDQFLAVLGHELRNPLAPIVTALQLVKLRDDGEASREYNIIARQVEQLVHLVDDLLDVSRITSGRVTLDKTRVDVRDVVARAIEATAPVFADKRHRLVVEAPQQPLFVDADHTRLTQVFTNLLANAAKYTEPGGHIVAALRCANDQVEVEIRDDGVGITADLLSSVFDVFVQAQQSPDRAGGLGLGLAIVRSLVALHGGSVEARSAGAGRGSSFVVRLPAPVHAIPVDPPALAFPVATTGRRILIVDDNDDARMLLAEVLGSLGHEVATAADGEQALTVVRTFTPDVAILDIGLPVMDGYELAVRLRQVLVVSPFLIALSGYGQPDDRAKAETAGFDRYLVKPIDVRRLLETLDEVAVRRGLEGAARGTRERRPPAPPTGG